MENLPNFIVNGVAKSGTTSMYHYLDAHPDIFMPKREEMDFFSFHQNNSVEYTSKARRISTVAEYLAYYQGSGRYRFRGDISPSYFKIPGTAQRIKEKIPTAKFITTLRNPVDRAYSGYQMHLRSDAVKPDISDMFSPDKHWVDLGLYYHRVKEYFDTFSRSQIHIVLLEDMKSSRERTLNGVFEFIGVETEKYNHERKKVHNPGYRPRNRLINNLARNNAVVNKYITPHIPTNLKAVARKLEQLNKAKIDPMSTENREKLKRFYYDDIRKLEDLIGRDLSQWR